MKKYPLLVLLISASAFCEAMAPAASQPSWLASLGHAMSSIPVSGYLVTIGGVILEFCLRIFKTQKPRSILYIARDLFVYLALGLNAVARLIDGMLQNSVDQSNPPPKV